MNGGRAESNGFTIVEVMIVLAITSLMFLGATLLISGRQNQTEFDQAITEVKTQIQQVINDVSNGYFPNLNNFTCTASPTGPLIASGAGGGQGTNTGCIFVGKVLRFGVNPGSKEKFLTYTIAGLQKDSSGNEVSSLNAAMPAVIAQSATYEPSAPNDIVTSALENGLSTYQTSTTSNGSPIGAIAFVSSLAPTNITQSSAQHVNLVPIAGLMTSMSPYAIDTALRAASPPINPAGGAQICFVSGTTNQSGLIVIGGNDSTLSVTLTIKGNKTCS